MSQERLSVYTWNTLHSKYYSDFLGDKMVMSEQPLNKLGQLSEPSNLKSNHREQGIPNSNRWIPNFNSGKTSPQPIPSQSELFHNQLGQGCANSSKIQFGIWRNSFNSKLFPVWIKVWQCIFYALLHYVSLQHFSYISHDITLHLEHCNKNKVKYNIGSKCLALQSFNFLCFLHKLKFAEISFYRERTFCSVLEMSSLQVYRFFLFWDHKYFSLSKNPKTPWKTVCNQLVKSALVFAIHFSDFYQKDIEM